MPRGDFNVHFESRGGGFYVRAEEAAGIAFLIIILAALFIIGCWYYRRRSGYKIIQTQSNGQTWRSLARSGQYSEGGSAAENKFALNEFSSLRPVIPNAPPAYEKISSGPLPPPYTP
ncbi:melanoma antigen recognized by T-cells 1 [Scleropages formosus]|uniref:Melan-A n=2 Tax=Scleropages formosus TaxID=113540 RepID=A0A8C9SH66_SCLFO|nr:melanoma antigen recognized by T-cells 1 [Scleropages formosus]